ncbi:MFS transporter [Peteryoungia desertarenae]|uniref:MFS transporter n=1 Tax=Peteryoungia desertarenae TaxID=1813451 RepID=A0ABX6QN35_9HYPH|nr:MFS transporter [Peteryoungia desertarenae]QLF69682.1 MFS transporter [Peteryoungia desertarenae]
MSATTKGEPQAHWRHLAILCLAVVLSMTAWFSATAVGPELVSLWSLSPAMSAWLTNGVQIGFVTGALLSSFVNLPDIVRLNRLMAIAALVAALANALLLVAPSPAMAMASRVLTGMALAGVYPPAMKLAATWFIKGRGLALGAVIAALTAGSALPHLTRAFSGSLDWQVVVISASVALIAAAILFQTAIHEGPYPFSRAVFRLGQIRDVLRDRNLLLANLGYFGHMWELYAMWAWLLTYLRAAPALADLSPGAASGLTFAAIAAGVVGCFAGGILSDRYGRTATTAGMMITSGACAAFIGFAFVGPAWLLALVILIWGASIIGDSAQFSAAVTELSDPRLVGTALSLQMAIGFLLTVGAIWLMPVLAEALDSWQWVFLFLVPGPAIGAGAMLALRRNPASLKLAQGRR